MNHITTPIIHGNNNLKPESDKSLAEIIFGNNISTAIYNLENAGFYLIKFGVIQNRYTSSEIRYKNVVDDYLTTPVTVGDLLVSIARNLDTIIPIPILNGKFLLTNYLIRDLPSKLMIVFINMNARLQSVISDNNSGDTLDFVMNLLNTQFEHSATPFPGFIDQSIAPELTVAHPPPTPPPEFAIAHPPPTPPPILGNTPSLPSPMGELTTPPLNIQNVMNSLGEHNAFLSTSRDKFHDELEILKNMGFVDEFKMIESLIISNGDINSAIHYYLQ